MKLGIETIRTNHGTQTRLKLNEQIVDEYHDAMEEGAVFPPVVVFYDGKLYYMADGFHRFEAALRAGILDIDADVREGTRRDALIYSLGANSSHGLRRNNADKRRCVIIALQEFADWSDRKIAETCAVSHPFVIKVRDEVVTVTTCGDSQQSQTRTGRDGKQYPAHKPRTTDKPEQADGLPEDNILQKSLPDWFPEPGTGAIASFKRDTVFILPAANVPYYFVEKMAWSDDSEGAWVEGIPRGLHSFGVELLIRRIWHLDPEAATWEYFECMPMSAGLCFDDVWRDKQLKRRKAS